MSYDETAILAEEVLFPTSSFYNRHNHLFWTFFQISRLAPEEWHILLRVEEVCISIPEETHE